MSSSPRQAIATGQIKARAPRFVLTAIAALMASAWGMSADAGPEGGVVQAGSATIKQTSATRVDINQSTPRAVINWKSFNVGAAEHVNFQQPSAQSATLNRIGGANPSTIQGRITANGQIFLINSNGILFGPKAKIEVGSLVAATANISNENFMAGRLKFDEVVNRNARIINQGQISVSQGGLVALVAPGVENSGIIQATLGKVALASGNAFTLDLYGDKLIQLAVDDKVMAALTDTEGKPLNAYVSHTGTIEADGGNVLITAAAAKTVLDKVINVSGVVQARSFSQHEGQIVLHGGDEGKVEVAGKLDASGNEPNAKGGSIAVLGEDVRLTPSATLDASGAAGGGTVKVGGDYQGKGDLPRSRSTTVEAGSVIKADALQAGDGGRVSVWSDGITRYAGRVSVAGGTSSGKGGFVEVSGKKKLVFEGSVDVAAPHGRGGVLLLDPDVLEINDAVAGQIVQVLRADGTSKNSADTEVIVLSEIVALDGTKSSQLEFAGPTITLQKSVRINGDLSFNGDVVVRPVQFTEAVFGGTFDPNDPVGTASPAVSGLGRIDLRASHIGFLGHMAADASELSEQTLKDSLPVLTNGKTLPPGYSPQLTPHHVALSLSAISIDLPAEADFITDNRPTALLPDTFQILVPKSATVQLATGSVTSNTQLNGFPYMLCFDFCKIDQINTFASQSYQPGWTGDNAGAPGEGSGNGVPPPPSPGALAFSVGGGGGGGDGGNRFTGIVPQDNGRNYREGQGLLDLVFSGDRGLARVADLGRSSSISGGGVDVFQARYHVIGTSQEPGGVTIDSAYVGKSPFDYMDERAARGRTAP